MIKTVTPVATILLLVGGQAAAAGSATAGMAVSDLVGSHAGTSGEIVGVALAALQVSDDVVFRHSPSSHRVITHKRLL